MKAADALLLSAGPASLVAGAGAAHWWFARAPASLARDRAQPLVVVTSWHGYGVVCFAFLAVSVALAAVALVALGRRAWVAPERVPLRAVVTAAAVSIAACWTWPFVFSSDPYAYAAYGDLALRGLNPYVPAPPRLHDATLDAARYQWRGPFPVCVYGPPFVTLARLAVVTAGGGSQPAGTLRLLRASAAAAFVASLLCLDAALVAAGARRRTLAVLAFGLNPVALWSVAEGHNDAYLMAVVLGAAALAARRRAATGAILLGLSAALKAPGALLAGAAALDAAFFARHERTRTLVALGLGAACAAAVTGPSLLTAFAFVRRHGSYAPSTSLQGLLGIGPAALLSALAVTAALARLRVRERDGFAWLGIALLAALPNAYPWYALWLVPFALAAGASYAAAGLYGATICGVLRYLPDAAGDLSAGALHLAAGATLAPLAVALGQLARSAARRKKALARP